MPTADAITKANDGSQFEEIVRKPNIFEGLNIPDTNRPIPNIAPNKRLIKLSYGLCYLLKDIIIYKVEKPIIIKIIANETHFHIL